MIRLMGEPQNPRIFWLVLLLAVMLLVGVSSSPAAAMTGAAPAGLAKDLGVLAALGEALQQPDPGMPSPVHPELADGGAVWLANVSVRHVRSLRQTLVALERQPPADDPEHRRLALEADRLHWQLLAFRGGQDDPGPLGHSLVRLGRPRPAATAPATGKSAALVPTILRGASF